MISPLAIGIASSLNFAAYNCCLSLPGAAPGMNEMLSAAKHDNERDK
jgi:hypothetical protein